MRIYHHWVTATAKHVTENDIEQLVRILQIPLYLFNKFTAKSGTTVYSWKAPHTSDSEAVAITIPAHALYGTLTIRGSYFDSYPDFPMHKLFEWIKAKEGNFKKLDISFEDTEQILDFAEIRNMCSLNNYSFFLAGSCVADRKKKRGELPDSNNRSGVPDVHANHDLIHFGNVSSPTCAKAYVMKNGNVKFELTISDKNHNHALLAVYRPETMELWETAAKQALVGCVNFVKPSSRKSKRLIQVESWEQFLGSAVKPIKWSDYSPAQDIETLTFEQALSRNIGQLQNMCRKFKIHDDVDDAIRQLNETITAAHIQLQQLGKAF